MHRLLVVLAAALLAVSGAWAASSPTTGTRGRVLGISANGTSVAIQAQLYTGSKSCSYGSAWTPATGKVVRFGNGVCVDQDARSDSFDAITVAGDSAAWSRYEYGNHPYCDGVSAAALAKPSSSHVVFSCSGDPSESVQIAGHGDLLVAGYNDYANLEVDRISGGQGTKIVTLTGNDSLLSADAGRFLVLAPKRMLVVYSAADGTMLTSIALPNGGGAQLSGTDLVVHDGVTVTVYNAVTGAVGVTRTLVSGGKWQDVDNGVVAYSAAGKIHLLTLATGTDRTVATVKGLVKADLEDAGLYYAWNDPKGGDKPGRVTFIPAAALS